MAVFTVRRYTLTADAGPIITPVRTTGIIPYGTTDTTGHIRSHNGRSKHQRSGNKPSKSARKRKKPFLAKKEARQTKNLQFLQVFLLFNIS
jgi:hypothetical protein